MYQFLVAVFYFIGLIFLLEEVLIVFRPKFKWEEYKRMLGYLEADDVETKKKAGGYIILTLGYTLWTVIGCFTVNWIYFALILLLSCLMSIKKLRRRVLGIFWLDGFLSAIIIILLLLYKFHHITIFI